MDFDSLLFDLDGTLVDSLPDLTTAINLLRKDLGLEDLTIAQVRNYVGDGATALVQRALPDGTFTGEHLAAFLDYYAQHLSADSAPYPGIPELLAQLRHIPLAVVTNKPVAMARQLLEDLDLARHFRLVLGGDSCATKKPHPEPLQQALDELGARTERSLMIGDHHTDLRAAAAAGIDAIFCCWGYGNNGGQNPRFVAETVANLQRILIPA